MHKGIISRGWRSFISQDLYGADEAEFDDRQETEESFEVKTTANVENDSPTEYKSQAPSNKVTSDAKKELSPSSSDKRPSDSAHSLSYSAQIAKQFSVYQQTPSQERQQRMALSSAPTSPITPTDGTPSAIASYESRTDNKPFIPHERPIRPSEMKDEGWVIIFGVAWPASRYSPIYAFISRRYLTVYYSYTSYWPYGAYVSKDYLYICALYSVYVSRLYTTV